MTDTATEPGLNLLSPGGAGGPNPKPIGGVNPPHKPRDPTAADRQRRYRQRKSSTNRNEDRNGERNEADGEATGDANSVVKATLEITVLCAQQDEIDIAFDEDGDAIITQKRWPDEDQTIIVSRENIDTFIDRLTDALGIPTFGRP